MSVLTEYPSIIQAVAWTELIVCQPNKGEQTSWDMMLSHQLSLDEILHCIQATIAGEENEGIMPRDVILAAQAQMRMPEYRRYLAGKLGLV